MVFDAESRLAAAAYERSPPYPRQGASSTTRRGVGWRPGGHRAQRSAPPASRRRRWRRSGVPTSAHGGGCGIANRCSSASGDRLAGQPHDERVNELLSQERPRQHHGLGDQARMELANLEDGFARAERGELCFGTIDSWLLWRLSGGRVHATDRPLQRVLPGLYDFTRRRDAKSPGAPETSRLAPAVDRRFEPALRQDRSGVFGAAVPLAGAAGDQQAAMFGGLAPAGAR